MRRIFLTPAGRAAVILSFECHFIAFSRHFMRECEFYMTFGNLKNCAMAGAKDSRN
jgi:hypothetical protein